jgi:gamma-glutamyltranspeptidase / glutathione hydrolase
VIEGRSIECARGAVATGPAEGARAGARILGSGGNAMDAAAAACLACAVMEPQAVDIGGYVAAGVVLDGRTGRIWSLDANSVAPAATREDMYEILPRRPGKIGITEREYGCSVRDDANVFGPLSVAVPGFMAGVGTLWERWGRLPWPQIVAPAQELIDGGLTYAPVRDAIVFRRDAIDRFPSTAEILLPGGRPPDPEQPWIRSDLAWTLRTLASRGWRDFYEGEIGRRIADFLLSQGGIVTREDMAAFAVRVTEPLSAEYRGAGVHTAIAPNGGFSVLWALEEMERVGLSLSDPPPDAYWHGLAGVLKRMWRRRLPDRGEGGTVHVAAADAEGNLVSVTISQGGLFGSCLTVPGTGIILGHGMCRFDPHAGLANSPGPGKRPLNNVCPMIIRTGSRDVAIGARGGRRMVSVCAQLAQRIVDLDVSTFEAAAAPRMHVLRDEPVEISADFSLQARAALEKMGHRTEVPDEVAGAAHGAEILRADGRLRAGGNTWAAGV